MELIVVIAIIGVLAAVLIPTFSGAIDSARQASDKSDVTHMNQELMIYKIQENVSSVDYHSALLWLTTNGYSLESSAKGYAYWFDEDAEQLVYAQVDEAITNANVVSADGDGIYDDPGKIAANKNLTLIDRRTDNPIITAVNGIRNLVQEASSVGSSFEAVVTAMETQFEKILDTVESNTKVAEVLTKFDPATTLYITENGVYSGAYQTKESTPESTQKATSVVFSDTLRVIDKLTVGKPTYQLDSMNIELPKTVALVMNGALSCLKAETGQKVTITAEKAQFIEGSLDPTVKTASNITTVTLDNLSGTEGSIDFTVRYAEKEALIKTADGKQRTVRVSVHEDETGKPLTAQEAKGKEPLTAEQAKEEDLLTNTVSDYWQEDGAMILREYLVPTFSFDGSFANVSGISIQMKKDGDLVVFYGITYGKNGTISQVVTFGYWTDITQVSSNVENDQNSDPKYQYNVSDPLRGYDFDGRYEGLEVKAFYEEEGKETPVKLTQNLAEDDTVYRSSVETTYDVKASKFTTSLAGLLLYAEYVQ